MPKYLDPKNDLLFKKVFGEHKNLCISLLNSLLKFEGNAQIKSIEYDTAELIPEIPALKDTIVDVRCKDKTGRQFIVEMQMNWTKDFEHRVLLNASKAYVRQVKKGEDVILAQPVYSLNLVNDIFDKDPKSEDIFYHQYKIVNIENTEKQIKGLEFVFLELPKYKPSNTNEQNYFNLWLMFLTEINENTKIIPDVLLQNKELRDAIKCVEESSLTQEELDLYDRVYDAIWSRKALIRGKRREALEEGLAKGLAKGEAKGLKKGEKLGLAKGKAEGLAKGEAKGLAKGEAKGLAKGEKIGLAKGLAKGNAKVAKVAKKLKSLGIPTAQISQATGLSIKQIENL